MGDIRTPDVQTDALLTNLAINWGDPAMIARQVFPVVGVEERGSKYPIYEEESFRLVADYRGESDVAREVDFPLSSDSYFCNDHALRRFLADQVWKNAQQNPGAKRALEQRVRVEQLKRMILRGHEKAVADLLTTYTNYLAALYENLDTAANRNFDDTSGPGALGLLLEFNDKIELACGMRANKLIVSSDTWQKMQADSNFFPSANAVNVTREQVANLLEIDEVLVARSAYSTSAKGAAASRSRLWGSNNAIFVISPPGASLEVPATGYTFAWNAFQGSSNGETVQTYRDPARGGGGEFVEYSFYYDVKKTGVNTSGELVSAALMTNCYASI